MYEPTSEPSRRSRRSVVWCTPPPVAVLAVLSVLLLAACQASGPGTASSPASSPTATDLPPEEVTPMSPGTFTLTSGAFQPSGAIPRRHSCDGANVSPPLAWSGMPAGTQGFALVVDDPDARGFVHWVAYGVAADATSFPEGVPASGPGAPPQGRNDFGRVGWGGPCPPSGTHRYVFTLYALSGPLALSGTPTAAQVRAAAQGKTLATAQLVGSYRR